MSDREPNERSEPIFVRKGLASPSPDSHDDLASSSQEGSSEKSAGIGSSGSEAATALAGNPQESGEAPPAGSLLSVDLKRHTGKAWIEDQKARPPGLTAEVSATLLSRQGNLPLDGKNGDRKQTWKQIRAALEAELASASEKEVAALPKWSAIKESLVREIGPDASGTEPDATPTSERLSAEAPEVAPFPATIPEPESDSFSELQPEPDTQLETDSEPRLPLDGPTVETSGATESGRAELFAKAGLASDSFQEPEKPQDDADLEALSEPAEFGAASEDAAETRAEVQSNQEENKIADDKPSLPLELPETDRIPDDTVITSEPVVLDKPAVGIARKESSQTTSLVLGLAAVLVVGAGLWYFLGSDGQAPSEVATTPDSSASPPSNPQTTAAIADPGATQDTSTVAAASKETVPAGTAEPAADPNAEASSAPAAAESPTESPTSGATVAATIEPSFDLIRIEPDGQAVIAGRAAPNTNLILLDNGKPIGTARSNADGEWAYIPDQPLPPGDHEFAMVVSTPKGEVLLPGQAAAKEDKESGETQDLVAEQPSSAPAPASTATEGATGSAETAALAAADKLQAALSAEPAPSDTGSTAAAAPVPKSKPSAALPDPLPPYGIQLSSVISRTAAEQSWQTLRGRFPDLLGDKRLLIQEVKLNQGGTRYRVQTGFFEELAPARKLCKAFAERQQDCLVFRR